MTSDNEGDVERKGQGKEDSMTKSDKSASNAPKIDHTSEELEEDRA